jgi:hypothetical protein
MRKIVVLVLALIVVLMLVPGWGQAHACWDGTEDTSHTSTVHLINPATGGHIYANASPTYAGTAGGGYIEYDNLGIEYVTEDLGSGRIGTNVICISVAGQHKHVL